MFKTAEWLEEVYAIVANESLVYLTNRFLSCDRTALIKLAERKEVLGQFLSFGTQLSIWAASGLKLINKAGRVWLLAGLGKKTVYIGVADAPDGDC